MLPTGNIDLTLASLAITNRYFENFQFEFCYAEQKIKVYERIEVAKVGQTQLSGQQDRNKKYKESVAF